MKRVRTPSPETRERLSALAERQLTPDEVRAAMAVPLSDSERDESLSLIRWFRRRYPTPRERLAYARRAYRRWSAAQGR
jgi:hypothetical protein